MAFDILSGYDQEEAALAAAAAGFFQDVAAVPSSKLQAAVKTGSIAPIVNSSAWNLAGEKLQLQVEKVQLSLIQGGLKSGASEIPSPAPRLGARIGEIAEQHAGARAVEMVQAIDDKTRAGLQIMIGRASREYAGNQSLAVLRRLEGEVRSSIGVTPKQAAKIDAWRAAAEKAGLPAEAITAEIARRSGNAMDLRARMIADRGVIESISFGRHQSWLEARDAGELPKNTKKQWRDQGDRRVHATHRAQSNVGPIPLDDVYTIMGVQHPPSHDAGCRCWETLYIPPPEDAPDAPDSTAEEPEPAQVTAADEVTRLRGEFDQIEAASQETAASLEREILESVAQSRALTAQLNAPVEEYSSLLLVEQLPPEDARVKAVADVINGLEDSRGAEWQREAELLARKRGLAEAARKEAHKALSIEAGSFDPKVRWASEMKPKRRNQVEEGLAWLRSVLGREVPAIGENTEVVIKAAGRPRSFQAGRTLFMSPKADAGTTVHEMGHWFERDPAVLQRSAEFLARRTTGEEAVRLSKLLPGHGYRADEWARADEFINPYTGKRYESAGEVTATEILSMGLESLYRDPIGFAKGDPDFFAFIIRFLRGL